MQPADLLATVPASTAALLHAARTAGLDATVPTCEDWRTSELLGHTAGVFRFITAVCETGGPVDRSTLAAPPEGEAIYDDIADVAQRAVQTIDAVGPDAEVWNWSDEPDTGAFWHRRLAHEAAMHTVDAQAAAGMTPAMDPEVAADGIDELLTVILPVLARTGRVKDLERIGSLHVHCTDIEGEWVVEPGEGSLAVRREHAKGDAALRGPALELLLRLYNRGAGGEVIGDAGVLDRWRETVRF